MRSGFPPDVARRGRVLHQLPGRFRLTAGFYLRYGFTGTGRVMWGENVLAYTV
jgi:hypothetical protein